MTRFFFFFKLLLIPPVGSCSYVRQTQAVPEHTSFLFAPAAPQSRTEMPGAVHLLFSPSVGEAGRLLEPPPFTGAGSALRGVPPICSPSLAPDGLGLLRYPTDSRDVALNS